MSFFTLPGSKKTIYHFVTLEWRDNDTLQYLSKSVHEKDNLSNCDSWSCDLFLINSVVHDSLRKDMRNYALRSVETCWLPTFHDIVRLFSLDVALFLFQKISPQSYIRPNEHVNVTKTTINRLSPDSYEHFQGFYRVEHRFALHVPSFQAVYIGMERVFYPKSLAKQMNVLRMIYGWVGVCHELDGTLGIAWMTCWCWKVI